MDRFELIIIAMQDDQEEVLFRGDGFQIRRRHIRQFLDRNPKLRAKLVAELLESLSRNRKMSSLNVGLVLSNPCGARVSPKPNLDQIESRRDQFEDGSDVPYQGRYGKW